MMNQAEIEEAYAHLPHDPNARKGVHLLYRLMQAVNAQSDGWAYWKAPAASAEKLEALLREKGALPRSGEESPITDAALRRVVAPIKAMVTKQKKVQARCGNTFDFDVEAVLLETEERAVRPMRKMAIGIEPWEVNLRTKSGSGEVFGIWILDPNHPEPHTVVDTNLLEAYPLSDADRKKIAGLPVLLAAAAAALREFSEWCGPEEEVTGEASIARNQSVRVFRHLREAVRLCGGRVPPEAEEEE